MEKTSTLVRFGVRLLSAVIGLVAFASANAQTPSVTPSPAAGDALLGEQYCFDVPWSNAGGPGYGPYLRLMLPPELAFDGAELFGSAMTVVSNAVFPGTPPDPSTLADPLFMPASGNQVSGTAGWRLVILELPVGSVVTGGPEMIASVCVTSRNAQPDLADIGTAYPIHVTPVYRYGATPTGSSSIVGTTQLPTVTPQVLLFDKDNTAPEHERPPGSVWPYTYVLRADVANGAQVSPLVIEDILPPEVQYTGPITITGAAEPGATCNVVTTPNIAPLAGGNLRVECTDVTGTGALGDIVVSFPAYITDILAENNCGTQDLVNTARAQGTYLPDGGSPVLLPWSADDSHVIARHVAVQKSAAQLYHVPGTSIAYSLHLQTTLFGTTNALSVLDDLPDGVNYNVGSAQISIGGGPAVAIVPVHSGVGHPETLSFDVVAANGGPIPPGTAIHITYGGALLQSYETPPNAPILASDPLVNTAQATYTLAEGATACTDGTTATVIIDPVEIRKDLLSTGPFMPGDYVTFRLSMSIPSGDTQGVVFTDFFPLPVFDVMDMDLTYGGPDVFRAMPPQANQDTLNLTPVITRDAATNSLTLTYPNIDTTSPQVVAVDVRVRVQPHAFADNLFLTNIFHARSENSGNVEAAGESPVQITVRSPALAMTKGVLSTNGQGTIAPPPATLPVNGNLTGADAGDQVIYRLTIENRGGAPAYGVVVTDVVPAGLTCTTVTAQLASGGALSTSGDLYGAGLTLTVGGDPSVPVLAPNDGSIGAPFGADTAFVDVTCTIAANVLPGSVHENTASATWLPLPGGEQFPPVSDVAQASVRNVALNKAVEATSEAASTGNNVMIGEIVRYRLAIHMPEGRIPDMRVFDVLPAGLQFMNDGTTRIAFVSSANGSITASGAGLGGIPTVIGAAANMAVTPLSFALPASAIEVGTGTLTCTPPGTFASGTAICFRLGDVTNAESDADAEFIVIEFNALVLNIAGNNGSTTRNNLFRVGSGTTPLINASNPGNASGNSNNAAVVPRNPGITVGKSVNPNSGVQAGTVVTYTLTFANAAGANVMPAYDVSVNDVLPAQLQLMSPGTISGVSTGGASCAASTFANTSAGNTVSGAIGVIPPGCTMTITYTATVLVEAAPGTSIVNNVSAGWNTLPGTNGTMPNDTGSNNPCVPPNTGVPGTATCERNFSGSATAPIGVTPVTLGKSVVATSLGYTGDGQVRPGVADLAIGETATFRITATIPEGTAPQVVITDVVPSTAVGRMEVLSGSVVSTGSGMTIATPSPLPVITDAQLGDGIADTISFNFGQVVNPVGNNTPTPQTIVVEVIARLVDHADNANNDQLTNNANVQFGPGLNGSASAGVDVVEPLLGIQKSSPTTTGQAGDVANFTVTVQHQAGSNMQARALRILDVLPSPSGLSLNLASVTPSVAGAGCVPAPVFTNASAGNTVDVGVDYLPLDCVLTIAYSAALQNDVVVNTDIANTANLTWYSISPADDPAGDGRTYTGSDNHTIRVSSPGMSKWVESVSPDIGSSQVDNTLPDLSIGAVVTWQFDVELPAGDSLAAVVTDQLPTGNVSMRVESSRIVSVGSAISGINATPTPVTGPSGTHSDGADPDTHNDRVTWSLGDLRAAPLAVADRSIRFEVVARVMDTPQTSGGISVTNTASFTASTIPTPISATSLIDIVEPGLTLTKTITTINGAPVDPARIVQAGDVVEFRIDISHTAASTASAFNVVVSDQLPSPGLSFAALVSSSVGCGATPSIGGTAPTVTFTLQNAPGELALGETCTLVYTATVTNDVNPGTTYNNSARAAYTSLADAGEDGVRTSTTAPDSDQITVWAPTLLKQTSSSSLADTTSAQHDGGIFDLAIGETVTYTLTIGFPQGTTLNAVLVDTLPAGLEAIGAGAPVLGHTPGISTTLPGTGVLSDSGVGYNDTVTFDFGTIVNLPNASNTDDWIQVTVTARVRDLPINVDGVALTNNAIFTNDTSDDVEDSAQVEVVEPELTLTKAMTSNGGGSATVTLTIQNVGTGPAYDIVLEDVLDDTVWNSGSITPAAVPGFTSAVLPNTPAAGQTTVRFTSNAGVGLLAPVPPAASTSVSASFTATLAVFPPNPNPVQNNAAIPTHGSVPFDPANPDIREYDPLDDDATLGFPNPVVTKTVTNAGTGAGGAFVPGDVVIFNVTVTNNGPAGADLVDATLTDVVPASTTFSTAGSHADWTCANLAPAGTSCALATPFTVPGNGGSVTRAFAVQIVNPLPAGVESVANQAFMSSPSLPPGTLVPSDDPGTPGDPDDPTVVPVLAAPDLVLTKADDVAPGDVAQPGDTILYTLSYQNTGNQGATGVVITETVPSHTTFNAGASAPGWACVPNGNAGSACTLNIGSVAAGAAAVNVAFAVTIADPVPAGVNSIGNTATVADDGNNGPDPTPENNSDDETTPLQGTPGMHLTKTDNDVTTVPGGTVVYTLRYWNDGNENVDNAVITETVPANTTFVPGASTAGWNCVPGNNAGATCTLAVGTLIGQTSAGSAATAQFAVQVGNPLPAGVDDITNIAILSGDGQDDVPAQDDTPVTAAPDLAIAKTAGAASVEPGDVLVYTLAYQNIGNQGATGVTITETVPANTTFNAGASTAGWNCVPDGNAGSTCTFVVAGEVVAGAAAVNVLFAVNIPDPIPAGVENVVNAVSIADDGANGPDSNPDNNVDDENTPVDAIPELVVTKTDNGLSVAPGDAITYTIDYENTGNQNASGVVLTETVPAHTTYTGAGWTCTPNANAGSTCTIAVGALAAGATGSASFVVTVADPIPAGVESIANRVTIHSDGEGGEPSTPPTDPADPRMDDEETPVEAVPELVVRKTDNDAVVSPGEQITYQITYENIGNQNATGVVLTETVPAHTTYSGSGWVCSPDANAGSSCVHAVAGEVVAGTAAVTVAFVVTVDSPVESGVDSIANRVTIHSDGEGGEPSTPPDPNDPADPRQDDEETPVEALPDLVIVKRANSQTAAPNMVLGFTLTYSNVGDQDATGVFITETVPLNTLFNDVASTPGWDCANGSPAGTVCIFDVGTLPADGVEHDVVFAVLVQGNGGVVNSVRIDDDGANGDDPTPINNESEVGVGGTPAWVPVGSPWALILLTLALGGLAYRERRRFG